MNLQIETKISDIADKARGRYEDAISAARKGTEKAAGRVSKGKKPVKAVSRFGTKLTGVSHRTVNKLWKRQTKLVEDPLAPTHVSDLPPTASSDCNRELRA